MNVWIVPVYHHHPLSWPGPAGQPPLVLHFWIFWDVKLRHSTYTILLSSKYLPSCETSRIWEMLLLKSNTARTQRCWWEAVHFKIKTLPIDWQSLHVCKSGRQSHSSTVCKTRGENGKIFINKTLEARHKTFNSVEHRIVELSWQFTCELWVSAFRQAIIPRKHPWWNRIINLFMNGIFQFMCSASNSSPTGKTPGDRRRAGPNPRSTVQGNILLCRPPFACSYASLKWVFQN